MASLHQYYASPEEYLETERKAESKSEYVDGSVYVMAGASERHNIIVANLIISLGSQLRGRPCKVYPSDLKVMAPNSSRFFYPEVSVVCGEARFADAHHDVLLNPTVIIEVLSDSTACFDKRKKFLSYQQIGSLLEYLLVWQDETLLEKFERQSEGWLYTKAGALDGTITLPAIECTLALMDVYDKTGVTS